MIVKTDQAEARGPRAGMDRDRPEAEVAPERLEELMIAGEVDVVDVRTPAEHARERLPGARLAPGGIGAAPVERPIVFYCRTGARSRAASSRTPGSATLAGGIEAWKRAGRAVVVAPGAPMEIMRQVQVVAGTLILLGVALGALVSPWFIAISAFVGAGLLFAGVSGWCGMAKLLARAPWNTRCARS